MIRIHCFRNYRILDRLPCTIIAAPEHTWPNYHNMCHWLQFGVLMNDLMLTSSQFTVQFLIQTMKVVAAHNTIECRKIFVYSLHYLATSKNHTIFFAHACMLLSIGRRRVSSPEFTDMQKWWRAIWKYMYTVFNKSFDTKEKYNRIANLMIIQLSL